MRWANLCSLFFILLQHGICTSAKAIRWSKCHCDWWRAASVSSNEQDHSAPLKSSDQHHFGLHNYSAEIVSAPSFFTISVGLLVNCLFCRSGLIGRTWCQWNVIINEWFIRMGYLLSSSLMRGRVSEPSCFSPALLSVNVSLTERRYYTWVFLQIDLFRDEFLLDGSILAPAMTALWFEIISESVCVCVCVCFSIQTWEMDPSALTIPSHVSGCGFWCPLIRTKTSFISPAYIDLCSCSDALSCPRLCPLALVFTNLRTSFHTHLSVSFTL